MRFCMTKKSLQVMKKTKYKLRFHLNSTNLVQQIMEIY